MKRLIVAIIAAALCLPAMAQRQPRKPQQQNIRTAPMPKNQGDPDAPASRPANPSPSPSQGVKGIAEKFRK